MITSTKSIIFFVFILCLFTIYQIKYCLFTFFCCVIYAFFTFGIFYVFCLISIIFFFTLYYFPMTFVLCGASAHSCTFLSFHLLLFLELELMGVLCFRFAFIFRILFNFWSWKCSRCVCDRVYGQWIWIARNDRKQTM